MSARVAFLLVLLALGSACKRAPEPPPPPPPKDTVPASAPIQEVDGDNLLNLAYGASVVSRTGELNLETSAVHAIDGMFFTTWTSTPNHARETLVFGLGAPSRIERLGITTLQADQTPEKVRFSASNDGRSWREVATLAFSERGTKIEPVKPFDARYLRVETLEPSKYYSAMASVHALGRELRAAERISFEGCWTVNGLHATLTQVGARVTGVIEGGRNPMYVDGGIEGRTARLMWMRGAMWGYAVATLTPDGSGLSAMTFHEEPIFNQVGEAWVGERCNAPASAARIAPRDFLRRAGHYTLSGLIFDDENHLVEDLSAETLNAAAALIRENPTQRFRLVSHELRDNDPKANERRSAARANAVREALRARGIDVARIAVEAKGREGIEYETPSAIQRMVWSRLDLTDNRVP